MRIFFSNAMPLKLKNGECMLGHSSSEVSISFFSITIENIMFEISKPIAKKKYS